jgi:peptide/nickel transport system substrate-binding protein
MKKKIAWLVVSCLMVAALVLASCGPAEEAEEEVITEEDGDMVKIQATKKDGTVVERLVEKPRYGGSLVTVMGYDPLYFDPSYGHQYGAYPLYYTNEKLIAGDWAKGPAGTDETTFTAGYLFPAPHLITGILLESWDLTDPNTIVMHVRQGVHWHNKPPMNGREFDADDVVYSMMYLWQQPKSFYAGTIPWDTNMESLTATDKWTVVLKAKPGKLAMVYEYGFGQMMLPPREVIEQYGNMQDWENVCGTGPFELIDYVNGSALTYKLVFTISIGNEAS